MDKYSLIILDRRCYNSKVVTALAEKTNQYGERRDIEAVFKSQAAAKIVKYVPSSDYIQNEFAQVAAKAIAVALELGKPVYGEVGEAFLKEKDSDYRKSKLGVLLAEIMLQGITSEVKDFILQETKKVLEGKTDLSEAAKAAIVATKIYDGALKRSDRNDFNGVSTSVLGKVLRATKQNETVTEVPSIAILAESESQKKLVPRTEHHRKILETAYDYFIENYGEIPEEYIVASKNFSRECVVAYYVASMRETDLIKINTGK